MDSPPFFTLFIFISTMFLQAISALEYSQELNNIEAYPHLLNIFSSPKISSPQPRSLSIAPTPTNSHPLVPALFVIGDSSVDCGTNNFLGTLARADRLPYGRDFDTHQPTGRFCNGRIPVDYLGISSISVWFLTKCMKKF